MSDLPDNPIARRLRSEEPGLVVDARKELEDAEASGTVSDAEIQETRARIEHAEQQTAGDD
jgi:hypothetical protein